MAVVPWTYNNPLVDRKKETSQRFLFQGHLLEILQDTQADIDATRNTGLKLWDGAYLLAKYLETTQDFPKGFWTGKKCIELGAGCGLVGMVAWLLGADIYITDLENTLDHTHKCVNMNKDKILKTNKELSADKIHILAYEWGTKPLNLDIPFDIILGSDIVYHPGVSDCLLKSISWLGDHGTTTLTSYKQRGLGEHSFFDKLPDYGFQTNIVSRDKHPVEFKGSDYEIYSLLKSNV